MVKRSMSAGLWFLTAVYAGTLLHAIVGVSELVGPTVGLATAAVIVGDPIRRLRGNVLGTESKRITRLEVA